MRARTLIACGAAALAVIAGVGCGSSTGTETAADAVGTSTADLQDRTCVGKIGVIAPYIGTDDTNSIQMNWARVALDTFNLKHGTDFQIEPVDSSGGGAKVRAGARSLAADKEVVGVVGPHTSAFVLDAGPILDRAGLVYVSPSATAVRLTDGSLKGFYRVVANDGVQGPTMARLVIDGLKGKNVTIFENDDPYADGLADAVEEKVKAAGLPVVRIKIPDKAASYAPWIARMPRDSDVAVLALTSPREAQRLTEQITASGRDPEFVGGDALFVPDEFAQVGAYVTSFAPDLRDLPEGAQIIRLYKAIFGNLATFGGPAYAATEAIARAALDTCDNGKATREGVWKAMPGIRIRDSVLGQQIAFTKDHELVNGRFHVYRINPEGYTRIE